MKILTFKLKYTGIKWIEYLENFLGKELAEKCSVESQATANTLIAIINIVNFNAQKEILNKIKENEDVFSGYLFNNQRITQIC